MNRLLSANGSVFAGSLFAGSVFAGSLLMGSLLASMAASAQPVPDHAVAAPAAKGVSPQAETGARSDEHLLKDAASGCAVVVFDAAQADAVSWAGHCDQGRASGTGTLTLSYKAKLVETLTGNFDKGALRDGHVAIKWPDGSAYDGNAVSGRMQGVGILTTAAGDRFEGEFAAGQLNGQGSAVWANGDRYDGMWHEGKAAGRGVQVWADGRKYDGEWRDDQPNGHGVAIRKDGSRYEGEFVDGQPKDAAQQTAGNPSTIVHAADVVEPPAKASVAVAAAKPDDADKSASTAPLGQSPGMAGLAGKRLVAVDGSSLKMTTVDDGLSREITAPNGAVKKNVFAFLNPKVGSVTDGDDTDAVVGVFRLTDKGIVADYSDGRSETLYPNTDGGVSMQLRAPDGQTYCMAWYPEGHRFSLDERKAALAEYANHLGIADPQPAHKGAKQAARQPAKPGCGVPAPLGAGLPSPRHAADTLAPAPRAAVRAALSRSLDRRRTATSMPASFIAPLPPDSHQSVEVRPSTVHLIDSDAPPVSPAPESSAQSAGETAALAPAKGASASTCLSVESDGQHWSFRNHCGYDVQFSYCLMNAADPLASCTKGSVSGSVAPNGSSALIADRSLSETNADHDFRWVACGGGAGEVVVHLDQSDPPAGRCVRLGAS